MRMETESRPRRWSVLAVAACAIATVGMPPDGRISVPRGRAPLIDGRIDAAEWSGAFSARLSDGSTIRLRRDDRYLFLAIESARAGFPTVCTDSGDVVNVFHASAALGRVAYERSPDGWTARDRAFVFGMRNPDRSREAHAERQRYLLEHRWVASTVRMGRGRQHELQIALDYLSAGSPRIAIGFYAYANPRPLGMVWPESLRTTEDGCLDPELLRGNVPPHLLFGLDRWAALSFP